MNNINRISHGNSRWRVMLEALVICGFLLTTLRIFADHTAVSTLSPPGYHSEEALTWCGAATGQMVIAGYPSGACTKDQADVDASIQLHKVESNWDTDPAGLRSAILEQCPLAPGHSWVVFHPTDAAALMWSAAHYMTTNQYPVAALLGTTQHNSYAPHKEHWVTITAITTDLDPTTNPTVTLKWVQFVDPSPDPFGGPPLVRFVSSAVWYAELTAVTKMPSTYTGQFVAIIEPPTPTGRAMPAGKLVLTGTVISKADASRFAVEAVRKFNLAEMQAFREIARARPLEPLLVNPRRGGYYLVPFSVDGKSASLAIIVNAYNGEFEEVGSFGSRSFLAETTALEDVRKALELREPIRPEEVKTELVSSYEAGTLYAPEWSITVGKRVLHVGQKGGVREVQAQRPPQ